MHTTDPDASALGAGRTIFDMWSEFRTLFDRPHVTPHTLELVRHGFYCGAMASFLIIVEAGASDATADDVTSKIEALRAELDGFRFDIRRPEATS
jgi:hypothetical protein